MLLAFFSAEQKLWQGRDRRAAAALVAVAVAVAVAATRLRLTCDTEIAGSVPGALHFVIIPLPVSRWPYLA